MQSTFVQCQPDIMGGTPVFSGSRVPVHTLVEYLQAGETIDDFLEGFPTVERSKVLAFLEEAERYASLAGARTPCVCCLTNAWIGACWAT